MFQLQSSFVPISHAHKQPGVLLIPGFAGNPLPVPFAARLMWDLYQCPSSCVLQQCWRLPHSCSPLPGGPGRVLVLGACLEATPRPCGRCHRSEGLSPTSQGSAQGRALCPLLHVQRLRGRETCCGACMQKKINKIIKIPPGELEITSARVPR